MDKAIRNQDLYSLRTLLRDKKKKLLQQKFEHDRTALHLASSYGNLRIVKEVLKYKGDISIDATDENGETALHLACHHLNFEIASRLISKRADVTKTSNRGNTPLHLLVARGPTAADFIKFFSIIDEILAKGGDINARNTVGDTPLHCAAASELTSMWLLRHSADHKLYNKRGETILHNAARCGSKSFVLFLLSIQVPPFRSSIIGTPAVYAMAAGNEDVAILLDSACKNCPLTEKNSLLLNGKDVEVTKLREFVKNLRTAKTEKTKIRFEGRTRGAHIDLPPISKVECTSDKIRLLYTALRINCSTLPAKAKRKPKKSPRSPRRISRLKTDDTNKVWEGIIRFLESESVNEDPHWISEYSKISAGEIKIYNEEREGVRFETLYGIGVYSKNLTRFSLHFTTDTESTRHLAANAEHLKAILQTIVNITGKLIQFIDDEPLRKVLETWETDKHGKSQPIGKTKERRNTYTPTKLLSKTSFTPRGDRRSYTDDVKSLVHHPILNGKGHILCSTHFASSIFSKNFSSRVMMQPEEEFRFLFTSGSIRDILTYGILHSGNRKFVGNNDVKAIYTSYYRYCSPGEVISIIKELWPDHVSTLWPSPYDEVSAEKQLYAFLLGFIESPFVLEDEKVELTFREQLISLYKELLSKPISNPNYVAMLRSSFDNMIQKRTKGLINRYCDLPSLLGRQCEKSPEFTFDLLEIDIDLLVCQIVYIGADLYKQLKVVEFLELRYQKDKEHFAIALNKLHSFSNMIYLLVPTSILYSDDLKKQKETLKRWIIVAENLFQLNDYNSTIQIINGITEASIMRLEHLKKSLSAKWIDRFDKMREIFSQDGSYAQYRLLPQDPPCIPFIGVALKDLVFACEANPDYTAANSINFPKMRMIQDILNTLMLEDPMIADFSELTFDVALSQKLLQTVPMSVDDLYSRSQQISEMILCEESMEEENKHLKALNQKYLAQIDLLKQQLSERDEQIVIFKSMLKEHVNLPIIIENDERVPESE